MSLLDNQMFTAAFLLSPKETKKTFKNHVTQLLGPEITENSINTKGFQ